MDDDDNGLELSLGLSYGGSSGKTKGNNNTGDSDNNRAVEDDGGTKLIDDFKDFLHPVAQKQEPSTGSHRSDSVKPQENFFSDLSKTASADADASMKRFWVDEAEAGNKRKGLFTEMKSQKKQENEAHNDLREKKQKTSHISITTEDGSTAENEDVAESEVGGSSDVAKDVRSSSDANVPFSVRPNSPYPLPVKDSNSNPVVIPSSILSHAASNKKQPANTGNSPVMFGYSSLQLPLLDKDSSWGLVTHSQQFLSPYAARGASNSATTKVAGKQHAAEEGSSNQTEDAKGSSTNLRSKDISSDQSTRDNSFSFDFSAIKPGIAADVQFGGSGSCANLPWVSTTGSGPHARTISGVTYRYSANQIRIVCACHGSHMSPEEFVRHASEEYITPEASIGLTATSAHT